MNVYDIVAERLILALEKDVVPWRQTWNGQIPMNYVSKKAYHGLNIMLLYGGETPYYLTYKQMESLKGSLKPGEGKKWSLVVYAKNFLRDNEETGKKEAHWVLRYYQVYNLAQTTLPLPDKNENPILESAEDLIAKYQEPPNITICANNPCYFPALDVINIPPIEDFFSSAEYYATLFHELVHSTGHTSRLGRFGKGYGGNSTYSEEELVAEIGACYLRAMCGIDPKPDVDDNSVAYIKHWHAQLKKDPAIIKRAIVAANKAAKWITGEKYE